MKTLLPPRELLAFLRQWKPQMKQPLLGMDYGRKSLGLAVSDEDYTTAIPLRNVNVEDMDVLQSKIVLLDICQTYGIGGLVVGWPLLPDGTESKQCGAVYSYIRELDLPLPTTFWDERYSSQTAEAYRNFARHSRHGRGRKKRGVAAKEITDDLAASHILQAYLDFVKLDG